MILLAILAAKFSSALYALAAQHDFGWNQPLVAGSLAVVIVEEFERPFPQLHDGDIGRRASIERATVLEGRETTRRIHGGGCDDLIERHTEHEKLRHDIRQIDNPARF